VTFITRFAPSPTGPLHLGHAFSALTADAMAQQAGGRFLLRIEDIDRTRARPAWEQQIHDDLRWLGLDWPQPVMRQSERLPAYRAALQTLWERGLLYPCSCTRRDIAEAASAPQEGAGPVIGPDGPVYPGICRAKPRHGPLPEGALRLDMARAIAELGLSEAGFTETGSPEDPRFTAADLTSTVGDIVLSRRDFPGSYHLSVVVDDAAQGITHVVRGQDLFEATKIHVLLQRLLGLPTPAYHHHGLIRDAAGKRLAKRDDARALATYRAAGKTPEDIRRMVGLA
jgi:glutamyl-Q tRNA(Asp) synthetase